jgi:DNA-binding IclR family transcriptional regulator
VTADTTLDSGDRMFDILEALKETTSAGVTELAERLDMPKSTVHVHLSTLRDRGYVVQTEDKQYRLSLKFLDMGTIARENQTVYDEIVPKLEELAEETEEKSWCAVEENGKAVFIGKATGAHGIQTNVRIGQHVELYRLAAGKAILANLADGRRREILDGYEFPLEEGLTRVEFEQDLATIRERGIAYGSGRFIDGVTGVGAPIADTSGTIYGAISISGPTDRLDNDRIRNELAELVRGVAGEMRVNLSYRR